MAEPAIYRIADRLAPALRAAFLQAIATLLETVTLAILIRAIESGDLATIVATIPIAKLPTALGPAVAVIEEVVRETATQTIADLGIDVSFTLVNPFAVNAAATQGSRFITNITLETQAAIRALVARATREGIAPRELARLIEPLIGLTTRQTQAALNYRAALVEAGLTGPALEKKVETYATKLLKQRALMIARTETIAAANEGQRAAWLAAVEAGLIDPGDTGRVWSATHDERVCPICDLLDGTTVAFDEPFIIESTGEALCGPPAHPLCRCTVSLVFGQRRAA